MPMSRGNGQLRSCEPCRKSKLGCDHQSPICGRCRSHGQVERCFSHSAQLTELHAQPSRVVSHRPQKRQRPGNQLVFRLDRNIPNTAAPSLSLPDEEYTPLSQHIARWAPTGKQSLGHRVPGRFSPQSILPIEEAGNPPTLTSPSDSSQVLLGVEILSHLQKIRWFCEIIELKNKVSPGWFLGPSITRALCDSMERMYDCAIRSSQSTHTSLATLSRQIFVNTSNEVQTYSTINAPEYFDSITARWETIGLVFALLGTALFLTPDDNPIFTHRNPWNLDKSELRNIAIAVGEICCQFCNNARATSDPFSWLITQQIVLLTMMCNYNDYRVWQKLGDLSTTVYALCLHQSGGYLEERFPFFLVEIRKRVMVCAYAIDKELATSLGRPPRICSRYCAIPLPLDISYETMVLPRCEAKKALQNLNENGWNTEGKLTVGVRLRVIKLISLLRESILELSLGPITQDILARAEFESRRTQQELPSFLRWCPEEATAGAYRSAKDEGRAFTHLEFTYQEFLLHRILLKRIGISSEGLIESSLEILITLSDRIAIQTRPAHLMTNMSWDLCYMGLPAAGILTSALLSENTSQIPNVSLLSLPANFRSLTIQKLSLFVSHLTMLVSPHQGIYEIAQQGARFIRRVLDRIESTYLQPASSLPDIELPESWLENCDLDGELDFMAWFDNIQWSQEALLNFT
ncbi:uncharacterized protein N7511_004669 [Penicillium nucicola]|uniref:uncharacterized protein n=1 Tax=Penicillium nucicola TaxID=1850975 RepID=UPI002544E85A|nr:uncharacterized protein N7511_004669 [Penicillium nucicola]KAJ5767053.1 hypothetical protein N7511_004669 [Penicillium nucicola]